MKFEDLKLPDNISTAQVRIASLVFDQMHAHYEAKLAEVKPAPEWRLPDPPPGQQWHRDDWTQDMLPEGYRPLLLGEPWVAGDEILRNAPDWHTAGSHPSDALNTGARAKQCHQRTRRPLPAPVEYVPLGPEDVPPGSAVRMRGKSTWMVALAVDELYLWTKSIGNVGISWYVLARDCEILRPGSTTWEPCKKPKP